MSEITTVHLDIVIPSFRADMDVLSAIWKLPIPKGMVRKVIIILDNPMTEPPAELQKWAHSGEITVICNEINRGANGARNIGIDASNADWILFLDDDIEPESDLLFVYFDAICTYQNKYPGFVGITRFPPAINNFTRGIVASDILTFFDLAAVKKTMPWGVTANLLISRQAIGEHRFRPIFPKSGGGEDIDFCLEIIKTYGQSLKTLDTAIVHHPWWNGGQRSYRRFFQWAYGDSLLPVLHPEHRWRNMPNTSELLFTASLALAILTIIDDVNSVLWLAVISGLLLGEWMGESLRLILRLKSFHPLLAFESSLIRTSNDLGRLKAVIKSMRPWRITERFDYNTTGEWISGERRIAFIKLSLQIITIWVLWNFLGGSF